MKRKELLFLSPEIYLVCATLYYWFLTSNIFNPIAMFLLRVLTFQIIYQKVAIGLVIATLFVVLNLYMVLALISELSEFIVTNESYTSLLVFGTLFLGFNLIAGTFMFWKYLKTNPINL